VQLCGRCVEQVRPNPVFNASIQKDRPLFDH
jgi:hypothetical protein